MRSLTILLVAVFVAGCGSGASLATPTATLPSPASTALPTAEPSVRPTPSPIVTTPSPAAGANPTAPPATPPPAATPTPAPSLPVVASGGLGTVRSSAGRASATTADARRGATAVNAFGVDLYRRLAGGKENVILSPASVMLGLAMLRPGARGTTAAEIDKVMRDAATGAHAAWLNGLDRALDGRSGTFKDEEGKRRTLTLRIPRAAFVQTGYPIEAAYLKALATRFGAGVKTLDYRADPEAARKTLNAWVAKRTDGHIKRLLKQGDVRQATRFALLNAVYLKAPWSRAFSPDDTVTAGFRLLNGTRIRVPTMVGPKEMGWIRYQSGTGWRAAELPYLNGELAMTVILPDNLRAFERSLTGRRLTAIIDDVAAAPLFRGSDGGVAWKIALPRFDYRSRIDLKKVLPAMGMRLAFDPPAADLTGIVDPARSGEPGLFVSKAIHEATISVDEEGTVATASTAILGETGGGPETKYFRVNRPFLFVIRDVPTGAILFMGRVTDPRKS